MAEVIPGRARAEPANPHAILHATQTVLYVVDADDGWRFLTIGENVERYTGHRAADLVGRFALDFAHPDDVAVESLLARMESGEPYDITYRFRCADGTWLWARDIGRMLVDGSGRRLIAGMVSPAATDPAQTQALLREKRSGWLQALGFIIQQLPAPVGIGDRSGHVVAMSRGFCDMLGYSEAELKAMPFSAYTHPEDLAAEMPLVAEMLAGQRSAYALEKRYLAKDGRIVWALFTAQMIEADDGHAGFFMAQDISAIREARGVAEAASANFLSLVRRSPVPMGLAAKSKMVTAANQAFCDLVGYSEDELKTISYTDYSHPEDLEAELPLVEKLFTGSAPGFALRKRYIRRDGRVLTVAFAAQRLDHATDDAFCFFVAQDVTALVEANAELARSQALIAPAFDDSPFATALIAPDGRFLRLNRAMTELTGCTLAEANAGACEILTDPETRSEEVALAAECLAGARDGYVIEKRLRRKDHSHRDVRLNSRLVRDDEGRPQFFVVHMEDVTRITAAYNALRASEQLFNSAFARAPLGVFIAMPDGRLVKVNERFVAIAGRAEHEVNGVHIDHFLHPDDQAAAVERMAQLRLGGVDSLDEVWRIQRPCGEVAWVHFAFATVRDEAGRRGYVVGHALDVTREHMAQQQLAERDQLFSAIADHADDVIIVLGANDSVRFCSAAAYRILGAGSIGSFCDLVASVCSDDVPPLRRALDAVRAGRKGVTLEFRAQAKGGRLVRFEGLASPISQGRRADIAIVLRDVTAQRAREEAIALARSAAETANRAKDAFIATMSHELRTPMTGVIGMLDLLSRTPLESSQQGFVEIAQQSAQGLLAILNDILDYSKVEAGRMEFTSEPFDVRAVVGQVVAVLAPTIAGKALRTSVLIGPDVPKLLRGDEVRIRQVLFNLIGNAAKFTEAGRITVRVTAAASDRFRFAVEDTGIGIPADRLRALFKPFSQVDSSRARRYSGTGLGLAICKRIVGGMGGTISVESIEGQGSTFWFELPLEAGADATPAPGAGPGTAAASDGACILVAEDHPVNQQIVRAYLESAGHSVTVVPDGRAALEAVQRAPFDLVVMDMRMPVMDGITATAAIRALALPAARIPILGLTANALEQNRRECLAAGMDEVVTKPINPEEFLGAVARLACGQRLKQTA